jgi:hypothetical protein
MAGATWDADAHWYRGFRYVMDGETDPLLGNRVPSLGNHVTDGVSLPQPSGWGQRLAGLPQFVTVRGGAYFFLPSLRALRFFARQSGTG